ncbi:deoxyguanosinetriphosphate triphosphohydrolase [Oceanimonas sp. GK1]|uniref:dGTPase n=1 Tax=Oceanimonas sp. (strain GK1 / IBRC-M 10197) TaxID=511062 RepID=UPI0002494D15|nr:dGTPase [Oceanimonas sp. GK1]AEY00541.1 deoxyguanosinetriphosphate triphosphohydrolase [Oceanimonas sp. GK1]
MSRYAAFIRADRLRPEPKAETPEQAIEADRARIVQSSPVRRLQQKTQVFPLDVKASVRSRLTHSLEVKETGRQLALRVVAGLEPEVEREPLISLVEMACLLHDVGNPPFGHFGEAVIIDWLSRHLPALFRRAVGRPSRQWPMLLADLRQFEGNAQSLRLLHSLQDMNLTLSQLAAVQKYVRGAYQPKTGGRWQQKPGHFFSERPLIQQIRQLFPTTARGRHPLAFLMEAADDMAYGVADLEDAVDRGVLSLAELELALLNDGNDYLKQLWQQARVAEPGFFGRFRQRLGADLLPLVSEQYLAHQQAILDGEHDQPLLAVEQPPAQALHWLKSFAHDHVFRRREVESLELAGFAALKGVLEAFAPLLALSAAEFTALERRQDANGQVLRRLFHRLPPRHLAAYRRDSEQAPFFESGAEREWYFRVRLLLDFISGMTDTYVLEEFRLLGGLQG